MATDQWLVGIGNAVWYSNDDGVNWSAATLPGVPSGFTRSILCAAHNGDTVSPEWVVCAFLSNGSTSQFITSAFVSSDGSTFSSNDVGITEATNAGIPKGIVYDETNSKWIILTATGVHTATDPNGEWATVSLSAYFDDSNNSPRIAHKAGVTVVAGLNSGAEFVAVMSDDGGATWSEVTLPARFYDTTYLSWQQPQAFWSHPLQRFVVTAPQGGVSDFGVLAAYSEDGTTWELAADLSGPRAYIEDGGESYGIFANYDCNTMVASVWDSIGDDTLVYTTGNLFTFTALTMPAAFETSYFEPSVGCDKQGRLIVFGLDTLGDMIAQYTDDLSAWNACTLPATVSDLVSFLQFSVPAGGAVDDCPNPVLLFDQIDALAEIAGDYTEDVEDSAQAAATESVDAVKGENVSVSVTITDVAQYDWLLFLSESAAFTDSVVMELSLSVTDGFNAEDAVVSNVNYTVLVTAVAEFSDRLMVAFTETVTDSAAAADAVTLLRESLANVSETIGVTDSVTLAGSTMTVLATATVQVSDTTVTGWLVLAEDGMDASEAVVSQLVATDAVTDTMAVTETLSLERTVVVVEVDTIMVTDTASVQQVLTELLEDGVVLATSVSFGAEDYDAWVINTQTLGPSQYTNFPFNSFALYRGQYYAAGDDGVYVLEGETDEGSAIAARVRTGLSNLGSGRQKRMPQAYLGYTSSGELVLKVRITGVTGEKREYWYRGTKQTADATREGRIKIGRGLKSVYWEFELCNKDGAEFELDVIQLWPMILDRRLGNV